MKVRASEIVLKPWYQRMFCFGKGWPGVDGPETSDFKTKDGKLVSDVVGNLAMKLQNSQTNLSRFVAGENSGELLKLEESLKGVLNIRGPEKNPIWEKFLELKSAYLTNAFELVKKLGSELAELLNPELETLVGIDRIYAGTN